MTPDIKDELKAMQAQLDEFASYLRGANELLSQMATKQGISGYLLSFLLLERCLETSNPLATLADFRSRVIDTFSADHEHVALLEGWPAENTKIRDAYVAELQPILATVERILLERAGVSETVH